jgi:hypothetical protein
MSFLLFTYYVIHVYCYCNVYDKQGGGYLFMYVLTGHIIIITCTKYYLHIGSSSIL